MGDRDSPESVMEIRMKVAPRVEVDTQDDTKAATATAMVAAVETVRPQ